MKRLLFSFLLLVWCAAGRADDRPSILWITAEDMSPVLGCYDDQFAVSPNIDRLATESVRYTRAFASAPVCSPSRSCLITGCYPPSLSTQQMRSGFAIPKSMRGFPEHLRVRGYYTSNNVKTDYNTGNYADMAKAFGGYGERVTSPNEIVPAIQRGIEATEKGQAALLEFITSKEIEFSIFEELAYRG